MQRSQRAAQEASLAERRAPPNADRGARFAGFAPNTYDSTSRSVEAILSVGSAVRRWGFVEELEISTTAIDLTRVERGLVPLLNAHDRWAIGSVLGAVSNVRIENGQLLGRLNFADTEAGREAEGMVSRGELRGISVGYAVTQWRLSAVDDLNVETWLATSWELQEVSLVPVPADPAAGVRSAAPTVPGIGANAANNEDPEMKRNLPGGAVAPAAPVTATAPAAPASEGVRSELTATAVVPAAAPPVAVEQAASARHAAFTGRAAIDFVEMARSLPGECVARANELISQNERGEISVATAYAELNRTALEGQRAATSGVATGGRVIEITADAQDRWMRGAAAALYRRAGVADIVARAARERGETIDLNPGEFARMRNVDLARMALEQAGLGSRSYDPDQIVREALTVRGGPAQTTSMFPILLEHVMNGTLQAAYLTTPDTWRRFCGVGSVVDFREHPRYLRGTFGELDDLTESGEIKRKAIPDGAKETIKATTKANIVALTRQAIVNDDLGVFSFVMTDLGRASKLSVELAVYRLLAQNSGLGPIMSDGKTLFHADHGNMAAIGGAPSVETFDAMRVLMAQQKDVSGNEVLDIRPAVWHGPIGIGGDARVINDAVYDPDTANKLQKPNKVRGLFTDIVDTARMTGTRWNAFADPGTNPALEVVFLNGNQEPMLDQREAWGTDGSEWKVVFDFGVGALNWRSAGTNAGA